MAKAPAVPEGVLGEAQGLLARLEALGDDAPGLAAARAYLRSLSATAGHGARDGATPGASAKPAERAPAAAEEVAAAADEPRPTTWAALRAEPDFLREIEAVSTSACARAPPAQAQPPQHQCAPAEAPPSANPAPASSRDGNHQDHAQDSTQDYAQELFNEIVRGLDEKKARREERREQLERQFRLPGPPAPPPPP